MWLRSPSGSTRKMRRILPAEGSRPRPWRWDGVTCTGNGTCPRVCRGRQVGKERAAWVPQCSEGHAWGFAFASWTAGDSAPLQVFTAVLQSCHFLLFSRSVMSDSLRPHRLQHTRHPCPSPSPGVYSNSSIELVMPPTILSSVIPFSSCLLSFPASGPFPVSQLFGIRTKNEKLSFTECLLCARLSEPHLIWEPPYDVGTMATLS